MDIPTLKTWDGYDKIGTQFYSRQLYTHISAKELEQIKKALKRKPIKVVALDFKRAYSTIWEIARKLNDF